MFTNYSVFDENLDKIELVEIKKNHELLAEFENDKEIKILKWFSKGYYNVEKNKDGSFTYNDLKVAVVPADIMGKITFGMNFNITKTGSGIMITDNRKQPEFPEGAFGRFWERLKGF